MEQICVVHYALPSGVGHMLSSMIGVELALIIANKTKSQKTYNTSGISKFKFANFSPNESDDVSKEAAPAVGSTFWLAKRYYMISDSFGAASSGEQLYLLIAWEGWPLSEQTPWE